MAKYPTGFLVEGTQHVTFIENPDLNKDNDRAWYNHHTRHPQYQGWLNSATWCFNLYFMQEQELVQALERLRRTSDRKINYKRAQRLFNQSQYNGSMHRVDDWCEGSVSYMEIVDNYLSDHP